MHCQGCWDKGSFPDSVLHPSEEGRGKGWPRSSEKRLSSFTTLNWKVLLTRLAHVGLAKSEL